MTLGMNDDNVVSIAQLREFLKLSQGAKFTSENRKEAYEWVGRTLTKFRYSRLRKKEKGIVKKYLITMTGYSETQIDRLINRKKEWGRVVPKKRTQPTFERVYTSEDIALLSEVDNAEGRRTGGALRKTLADMFHLYKDERFERIANISIAHIYNLRGTRQYESKSLTYTKTPTTSVDIGIRKKPRPDGKPGFLRVDSVHQGDSDKQKGVYHIMLVDEVTQWDVVGCVEGISEQFLLPLLEALLDLFPFRILNFHSDNGSEYINYVVAKLLAKLTIEQTKSRARRTNDNALVEGKNAAVIRKYMGYAYIPGKYATLINRFYREHMDDYLDFHRPCGFATVKIDRRGKEKKKYDTYITPFEKLKRIPDVETYLKPDVTIETLEAAARKESDNACAERLQNAKRILLETIHQC